MGITPACAGISTGEHYRAINNEDHPRVRGDKGLGVLAVGHYVGSPPRARG